MIWPGQTGPLSGFGCMFNFNCFILKRRQAHVSLMSMLRLCGDKLMSI